MSGLGTICMMFVASFLIVSSLEGAEEDGAFKYLL